MIPYAILSGTIIYDQETASGIQQISKQDCNIQPIEIRILELSPDSFTFRLPRRYVSTMENVSAFFISLHFLDFDTYQYKKLLISIQKPMLQWVDRDSELFYTVYRIDVADEEYRRLSNMVMQQYMHYIHLKLEESDAALSKELTGYPAELEGQYSYENEVLPVVHDSYSIQENVSMKKMEQNQNTDHQLGILLSSRKQVKYFLDQDYNIFLQEYWGIHHLSDHPISKQRVTHIYFGNAYCSKLLPDFRTCQSVINHCFDLQLIPVLQLAPMHVGEEDSIRKYLMDLASWLLNQDHTLELVVNDWGILQILSELEWKDVVHDSPYSITLGNLLHKRRKDPRYPYKKGFEQQKQYLEYTNVDDAAYRQYLMDRYHVEHILYESCGYTYRIRQDGDLMIPYYQTNTSGHCTLYALCHYGDRGHQVAVNQCLFYCEDYSLRYPDSVKVIGRYNSLFGYDDQILKNEQYLDYFYEQGFRRLILNF